jgi:transglutaminase-like putative cysteine protease
VVLRDLGVPARVVEGFLPGQRSPGSTLEVISNSNAHAWVEVYFPGHGWVAFDPTRGLLPQVSPVSR